jgi:hypothetical protein
MNSMTTFRTLVISLALSFVNYAFAQNGTWMKGAEGWIRLTCHGVITPLGVVPYIEKQIMIGHIKINSNQPYPSLEKLANENPQFFKDLTEQCTNRRRAMVDLTDYNPADWLDWDSEFAYTRLEVGEEFISKSMAGQCRQQGQPCESTAQCCHSGKPSPVYCNLKIKTCETNSIKLKERSSVISE